MSNSPLTKVPTSALSPVSALAFRKPDQVPQALSKQAIDLQNTLNKLKEAKQRKQQLSNSNIVVQSITNPVSSPQNIKHTEESEPMQIQYKSLFKDIESPQVSQPKTYNKMNDQEAEQKYEQRKKQIKEQIDRTKSNSKILQKPKQKQKKTVAKQIQKIDLSKNSNKKQKQESVPEVKTIAPQKPKEVLHDQLKVMQNKLKQDIAKLDKQIKGENQTCLFDIKNKGHDLYQQGLQMEDRKQFKQKIHEREKQQKEMQECTFKPQISQPKTLNNQSRQVQSRIQQNESKLQLKCQSHRDGQVTSKRLSCSPSQDQINSTTMTQTLNNTNDIHSYLNRIQDKYQQIVNRANALQIKGL